MNYPIKNQVTSSQNIDCQFDGIIKILDKMQAKLEKIERNEIEIHELKMKILKRLCERVDVLEKRLGVVPEPMPRVD